MALQEDTAAAVSARSRSADGETDSGDSTAEETSAISEYTGGIIDLVKSGFQSCMGLKDAYEEYQLIEEDSEEGASRFDGAKMAFEVALSGTIGILSGINEYQKSFGTVQSLAIKAAIPAIGIVLSTISLIGRIVTLVQQGNFDFGKTATESQTDSLRSQAMTRRRRK